MATQHAVAVREQPLVSVAMVTYNHQSYIAQAIEGVLAQHTTFSVELIVTDDHSTDGTAMIINDLAKQHKSLIKPVLREQNVGSMANFVDTLKRCKGKYVAICDGDDYWTDPDKLQKQVAFMEGNPDYAICAHPTELQEGEVKRSYPNEYLAKDGELLISDLAAGNLFYTSSVLYRNGLFEQFPEWINRSPVGDYVLHMLNARKGKLKYLPDTMSVYRKHGGGIWNATPMAEVLEKWLLVLDLLMSEEFEPSIKIILQQQRMDAADGLLQFLLKFQPAEFIHKFKTLTVQDEVLEGRWLDKLINDARDYMEVKPRYQSLKRSRCRKYLSYIFPQLKM